MKLQLVRIEHERCGEWSGYTYVGAPQDWSQEQIEEAVTNAEKKYLATFEQAREESPRPPYVTLSQIGEANPDLTYREVQELVAEKQRAVGEWQSRQWKQSKKFEDFLDTEGFKRLRDIDPDADVVVNWGHNHGKSLRYGDEETDTFVTPAEMAGREIDRDDLI
jgi:hypothetical protein